MDAIKKKMQAMKLEKDNAQDKADTCEGQAKDANLRADKAESEMAAQNRKVQLIEEDLERSEERSNTALTKLAEASEAAEEAKR
uniref:(California timema) hypothetical protein n=1 Tax=Timema californicum TaxID=61474 RepID=A0A7R9IZ18_TIMCA|nr:unnamed protein product [Timema californicum]